MAHLRIFNSHTGTEGNPSVLYDQNASEEIQINFTDGVGDLFTADENAPVAGKYKASTAAWEIFGPDGPVVTLAVNDPNAPTGTAANPATFTPDIPGRWLVRLTIHKYVTDENLAVVESASPEIFTALYEIQDPNIIGHFDARPYGNGSVSRGASTIAPNESVEYDGDEGWSRGIERYLATVSREQGFRSTAVVINTSGVAISAGKLVRPADQDALMQWKKCSSGLWEYQNTILKVTTALATEQVIQTMPMFLCVEDIPDGERGVVLVSGSIPYDTTNFNNGDVLFVSDIGEITNQPANATHMLRVGYCTIAGELDSAVNPGGVFFHGHAHSFPGLVQGPLSSTDDAIATWDGNGGNKLKDTNVLIRLEGQNNVIRPDAGQPALVVESNVGGWSTFQSTNTTDGTPTGTVDLKSGMAQLGASGFVSVRSGEATQGGSGGLQLTTGTAGSVSGSTSLGTGDGQRAGEINISPGVSNLDAGPNVNIKGGDANSNDGGDAIIKGGNSSLANALPGGVIISGGSNFVDTTFGNILFSNASEFRVASSVDRIRSWSPQTIWEASDPAQLGPDKTRAVMVTDYGTTTSFAMYDTAGVEAVKLDPDNHSVFKSPVSIGMDAPPGQQPNLNLPDIFHVEGNGYFENLTIKDKLNVGGLIDPTGLVLSHNDGSTFPAFGNAETVLYVSDGTDGVTIDGHLYQVGPGGAIDLTLGAQGGGQIASPGQGTTRPGQVATWTTADGDALAGSGIECTNDGQVRTIVDPVTTLALEMNIQPGDHGAAGDNAGSTLYLNGGRPTNAGDGGTVRIEGGPSEGGAPGEVLVKGGYSTQSVQDGGSLRLYGGAGAMDAPGNEGTGGDAGLIGGNGAATGGAATVSGGSALYDNGEPGTGVGGSAIIQGGSGGRNGAISGAAAIYGGTGSHGQPGQYKGGAGGHIYLIGGDGGSVSGAAGGGVEIRGGKGDTLDPASGWVGGSTGGPVTITAGDSMDDPIGLAVPSQLPGAVVRIRGGNAGTNTEAPGGNIYIEPGAKDANQVPGGNQLDGWNGNLYLCHEDQNGFQKSWVVIGNKNVSGQAHDIGMCVGKPAHTIHGDLKVTGVIDPTAIFFEPMAQNPVEEQLQAADASGAVDLDGNPIDANSPESIKKINNAIWFDSNNEDRLTIGSEPVGTPGTVKYDFETVIFDPNQATSGGPYVGEITPGAPVHYFDVPDKVSRVTVDSTHGDVAVMLPPAAAHSGRSIVIKDSKGKSNEPGNGQIFIGPPDGESLDQYTYQVPYPLQQWEARECWSNGETWLLM